MSGQILRAKIVAILDNQRVIIDAGLEDGVMPESQFFIYEEGEEIKDPDTGHVLGNLENVKAHVEAFLVQEKMSVLMPIDVKKKDSTSVLSASLAQVYSSAKEQYANRGQMNVRQDQIFGTRQPSQIAIGDKVRSVFPNG